MHLCSHALQPVATSMVFVLRVVQSFRKDVANIDLALEHLWTGGLEHLCCWRGGRSTPSGNLTAICFLVGIAYRAGYRSSPRGGGGCRVMDWCLNAIERCVGEEISDPLSLKRHSSKPNRPTSFLVDFYERSNIFLQKKKLFHSVQVPTHLVAISNSVNPCKNAYREVASYLPPDAVANASIIYGISTGADPGFLPGKGAKGLMTLYGMGMSDFWHTQTQICNFSRCVLPYYAWMVLNNHSRDTSVPSFCPWDEGTRAGRRTQRPLPPGSAPAPCKISWNKRGMGVESGGMWERPPQSKHLRGTSPQKLWYFSFFLTHMKILHFSPFS